MTYLRRLFVLAFFVLTILCISLINAEAGFLSSFEGYSVFGNNDQGGSTNVCPLCDSTVSFTVYQNIGGTTGNWITDLGLSSVQTDLWNTSTGLEQYVYMYQVVNTNPLTSAEQALENYNVSYGIQGTSNSFLSGGYFYNTVFTSASSAISPLDTPTDGTPSSVSTITTTPFNTNSNARDPDTLMTTLIAQPGVASGAFFEGMLWSWNVGGTDGDGLVETNGTSSIAFLTSNVAPTYRWAESESPGGYGAPGDVPSIVPEPISSTLFIIGGATLGFRRFWKKRMTT